jgi:GTP cyclohydrolase IA
MNEKSLPLGELVRLMLVHKGLESPSNWHMHEMADTIIRDHFAGIMMALGLDYEHNDSLVRSPERVAKMYTQEVFWGLNYMNFPNMSVIENSMRYDEMISCKCTVKSMCEHHFVPFIGIAFVAYIPNTRVLGLSKFNRVVDFFSRRPQVQERLTAQIQKTLEFLIDTVDVAVVVKAQHYCVHLRGVEDTNSETITSAMGGRFLSNPALRQEFLALTR